MEDEFPFGVWPIFRGENASFREGILPPIIKEVKKWLYLNSIGVTHSPLPWLWAEGVVYTLHPINRRQYMHDDGRWRNGFALQTNILLSGYSSCSTGNTPPTGLLFIAIIDYRRVDDSGIFVHLLFRSATIKTTLKPRIRLDICPKKPQYCSHLFTVSKGKNHTRHQWLM